MQRHKVWLPCSTPNHISCAALLSWIVAAQLAGLVLVGAYLWAEVFYFNDSHVVAYLTHGAADQPPAPRATVTVGVHTFGDFLLPYAQALVPNPWTDYTRQPQNYPSGLVTFYKMLTLLPYAVALPLFLLASVVCMLVPMIVATRALPVFIKLSAYCVFIFMTSPFLMVLDRGNVQGLLVVPLFVFASAWRLHRWPAAMWALVAITVLKVYPLVLVVAFVAERKWKEAVTAIAFSGAVTLILFAAYPGSLVGTLNAFRRALEPFSAPHALTLTSGNYSLAGMLTKLAALLFGKRCAFSEALGNHPWLVAAAYVLFVTMLLCANTLPFVVKLALAFTLLSMVVPVSYGYTLVYVFVVVAELVRQAVLEYTSRTSSEGIRIFVAIPLAIAIVLTLVPDPVPLHDGVSSLATILVPGAWFAFSVACSLSLLNVRRYSRTGVAT